MREEILRDRCFSLRKKNKKQGPSWTKPELDSTWETREENERAARARIMLVWVFWNRV